VTNHWGAVASVQIDVLDGAGTTFASTLTESTGSYLVSQVPAGTYEVLVHPPSNQTAAINPQSTAVSAGAISEVEFALTSTIPVPALPRPFIGLTALLLITLGWLVLRQQRVVK